MHPRVLEVTERLVERSRKTRERYLAMMAAAASEGPQRGKLQCANFAHGVAGCNSGEDKQSLRLMNAANGSRRFKSGPASCPTLCEDRLPPALKHDT